MKSLFPDFRQTPEYAEFMSRLGWKVILTNKIFKGNKKNYIYLWRIPFVNKYYLSMHKINSDVDLERLKTFCLNQKVSVARFDFNIFVIKEDNNINYKTIDWCSASPKTRIINLRRTLPHIQKDFKSKTKYNIRLAQKRGVRVEFFNIKTIKRKHILQFTAMLNKHHSKKGLAEFTPDTIHDLLEVFNNKCFLALAFLHNRVIAGTIFPISTDVFSYTQNGCTSAGRKNFAPTLIIWEAIKLAKSLNMRYFDFDGIYDARNSESTLSWEGFSKFKEGFGGEEIEFKLPGQILADSKDTPFERIKWEFTKKYLKDHELPSIYPSQIFI